MNEFNNIRRQLDAIDVRHKKLEKGMLRTVFAAAATLTTMSIAVFAGHTLPALCRCRCCRYARCRDPLREGRGGV